MDEQEKRPNFDRNLDDYNINPIGDIMMFANKYGIKHLINSYSFATATEDYKIVGMHMMTLETLLRQENKQPYSSGFNNLNSVFKNLLKFTRPAFGQPESSLYEKYSFAYINFLMKFESWSEYPHGSKIYTWAELCSEKAVRYALANISLLPTMKGGLENHLVPLLTRLVNRKIYATEYFDIKYWFAAECNAYIPTYINIKAWISQAEPNKYLLDRIIDSCPCINLVFHPEYAWFVKLLLENSPDKKTHIKMFWRCSQANSIINEIKEKIKNKKVIKSHFNLIWNCRAVFSMLDIDIAQVDKGLAKLLE